MKHFAACTTYSANLMRDPSHLAERFTQVLLNDRVIVLQQHGAWILVQPKDNEEAGWALRGQFSHITPDEFELPPIAYWPSTAGAFPFAGGTRFYEAKQIPEPCVSMESIPLPEVMSALACAYLNTPYHWGGLTMGGLDCSGLSKIVWRQAGVELSCFARLQAEAGRVVDFMQDVKAGDLAFFESPEGLIHHVGIMLSPYQLIHASEQAGRVLIQTIDQEGILGEGTGIRTHKLRVIKSLYPLASG